MEVLGIASIFPFMELLSNDNPLEESARLAWAYDYFGFQDERSFLIAAGVVVLTIITLSSIIAIGTTYAQHKIVWSIAHKKSVRLLSVYLKKPYAFYLNQNTSDLRAYLISEIANLIGGVITPLLEFISRTLVCLTIFSLLMMISPLVTLRVFFVLGGLYMIIYVSRQRYLKRLGQQRIDLNVKRYRYLDEMLSGIKTLKIYGVQRFFYSRYDQASKDFSIIQPKVKMVYATPKYLLELIAFGGILGVTLYTYMSFGDITKILPRLTLYAVAGYKLLPALQQAFSAISKVRHNLPSLDTLYDDLLLCKDDEGIDEKTTQKMPYDHAIDLNNISFAYEKTDQKVLNDVSLSIKKGDKIALVGSTGSGKTTMVDLITGLLKPSGGEIRIDGQPLIDSNMPSWQANIAYVPQEVFLYDDTIEANIALGSPDLNTQIMESALQMAEIKELIDQLPHGLQTVIGERGVRLSGGQRQRIGLARALYRQPSVLILDEATSALDNITEKSVIESIASLPKSLTVIIIAHRLSTVRKTDNIYIMENGSILQHGHYDDLLQNNQLFKKLVELS